MRALVVGASIAGISSSIFLAREGIEVVLIDADPTEPPDELTSDTLWFRGGTPHGRQAHAFLAGFVKTMRDRLPGFVDELVAKGAILRGVDELMPPALDDKRHQPGDDEVAVINARRPFVEWMLRRRMGSEDNIDFRAGVRAAALETTIKNGIPHIGGIRAESGETIAADVVIDASGRGSSVERWFVDAGISQPVFASEPCHQLYFTRYYLLKGSNDLPALNSRFVSITVFPWFAVLMFPGDNGVLQVAISFLPEDQPMKRVRYSEGFHAVAMAAPDIAPWVEPERSEPISDVGAMGALHNYTRRIVVDQTPLVTGIHLAGDSASITNPQYGRGVSHAVMHASAVVDAIVANPDDPKKQAIQVDEEFERMLVPSFHDSIAQDRMRDLFWRQGAGLTLERSDQFDVPVAKIMPLMAEGAAEKDAILWRRAIRGGLVLEPPGRWKFDEEMVARVESAEAEVPEFYRSPLPPREEILQLLE